MKLLMIIEPMLIYMIMKSKMTKLEKILLDYWYKNVDDLYDTLRNWWREWIFFENAMCCVREIIESFDLSHNEKE